MKPHHFLSSFLLCSCFSVSPAALAESESKNQYTQTVTRTVLAEGLPEAAPNQILELVRYEIPPFATLPPHIHPGLQIARVEFGLLTYAVIEGTALITRTDGTKETLTAGQKTLLKPGDAVTESEGMVHFGQNETPDPVIVLATSLLTVGEPKAILMEE
ncbi:cupin domain-containing protein [Synechococcus sp. BDU 130192]|uniref:cupin domain-containing protein n=1 Tax=Synechococcus sp. BDU 130192 TaxID=2042059 RepID=UPI000C08C7CA|nr:cupin domain-containing protein [Synechococcus sp. BDU 130192]